MIKTLDSLFRMLEIQHNINIKLEKRIELLEAKEKVGV